MGNRTSASRQILLLRARRVLVLVHAASIFTRHRVLGVDSSCSIFDLSVPQSIELDSGLRNIGFMEISAFMDQEKFLEPASANLKAAFASQLSFAHSSCYPQTTGCFTGIPAVLRYSRHTGKSKGVVLAETKTDTNKHS